MNISEADAANTVLRAAASRVRTLIALGMEDTDPIVLESTDLEGGQPRTVELGRVIQAGELLADKANKALGAGWDARRWHEAIGR